MRRLRWAVVTLILWGTILWTGTVNAADPVIKWQVFSGAGALATNGSITLNSSFGQAAVGVATTLTDRGTSGYWYFKGGLGVERRHVYLPIVMDNFNP